MPHALANKRARVASAGWNAGDLAVDCGAKETDPSSLPVTYENSKKILSNGLYAALNKTPLAHVFRAAAGLLFCCCRQFAKCNECSPSRRNSAEISPLAVYSGSNM